MGKHASTEPQKTRVAGWVWAALLAILLTTVVIISQMVIRSTSSNAQGCSDQPTYTLAVWSAKEASGAAEELAESFNADGATIGETCVQAEIQTIADEQVIAKIGEGQYAPIWIPADAKAGVEALQAANLPTTSAIVGMLEGKFPVLPTGEGATVVGAAPEGVENAALDAAGTTQAVSLFNEFVMANLPETSMASVDDILQGRTETLAAEAQADGESANAENGETATGDAATQNDGAFDQVTFLLDTSNAMGAWEGGETGQQRFEAVRAALSQAMIAEGEAGKSVALWNYSSPLSPGVTNPFRTNVDITVGDNGQGTAAVLAGLGFGGDAWTYQSVLAAYNAAILGAQATGADTTGRVVLITASPNLGGNADQAYTEAELQRLSDEANVQLHIVAVGPDVDVEALRKVAAATGGDVHTAATGADVTAALNAALQ